jgi:ATP-dependent DNA helicase RecQ
MIEYHPRQDKPQLFFPMARLAAEQLHFDTKSIKQLEKAATHRVKSMIQYLLIKECRTSYMKYYLGESANSDCGVCDNCIAKKHRANRSEQYKQLENELISLLQKNKKGVTIDALKLKFPGSHTYTLLRDVVKDLMDEHWVTYKGGKLYWND